MPAYPKNKGTIISPTIRRKYVVTHCNRWYIIHMLVVGVFSPYFILYTGTFYILFLNVLLIKVKNNKYLHARITVEQRYN